MNRWRFVLHPVCFTASPLNQSNQFWTGTLGHNAQVLRHLTTGFTYRY
jgi:hypothetical protein